MTEPTSKPPSPTSSTSPSESPTFADLDLPPPVLRAIADVGYEAPSSIQAEAIPPLLAGRDLIGQAQTGTGKTAAFALPALSRLDIRRLVPQVLVLAPTRELAIQVAEAMQTYARYLKGFHVAPIYGGQRIEGQLRQLNRGVHVVVGTPGRVLDHLRRGTLKLDHLATVVLDEADEMLRMGFLEEVQSILDQTPESRQVALFSATMPGPIARVAKTYLRDPVEVRIRAKTATVATVKQRYWRIAGVQKLDALTRILEVEDFDAMLVFVRTKVATADLAEKLEARGFASAPLNGDMNQAMRERTIERLKKGKLDIVVATDVAARGLHVDRISHVVNYDIPYDVEAYVHRIGRTARAGRKGEAILFVASRERRMLQAIERVTRQRIAPMQLPTREDITDRRIARFKRKISDTLEGQNVDFFADILADYLDEEDVDLMQVAAALALLVQQDRPLVLPGGPKAPKGSESARGTRPEERFQPDVRPSDIVWQRYRIEVGRDHGVQPGNIVGAIASEAELDGRYIGRIKIFETFSLVELPEGMPRETFRHLKTVRIAGRELRISSAGSSPVGRRKPRPSKSEKVTSKLALKRKKKKRKKRLGKSKKKSKPSPS
ncbi:MAG: DEAD/DEAH box helicase [Acidobacteriota bacterium]